MSTFTFQDLISVARTLPKVLLHEHLDGGLREATAKTVASLPEHHAYVARYCGAQEAAAA